MTTYVYETIPRKAGEKPLRFEFSQSMKDAPLTKHPETGKPVRRVISGGFGVIGKEAKDRPPNWQILEKGPVYHKDPRDHSHEHTGHGPDNHIDHHH